jgi:hypothetical protein
VAQYTHDGHGALVKRTMADGSWTVYIGGIYEEHQDETYVKYYSAFGRRIAMRDNAGVVHYILADHLGSSTTVTDAAGGEVAAMKYYPYGAERTVSGDMITDKLFTGQQREPEAVSALGCITLVLSSAEGTARASTARSPGGSPRRTHSCRTSQTWRRRWGRRSR